MKLRDVFASLEDLVSKKLYERSLIEVRDNRDNDGTDKHVRYVHWKSW